MTTLGVRGPGGARLSAQYGLDVRSSYSHIDGIWYQVPTHYPAALWDPHGYAIFSNEDELVRWANVGKKVNFDKHRPISSLPMYVRVTSLRLW